MYKILLDKNKLFECDIKIQGASSDNTQVRLVLETDDFSISFKGKIEDGKVQIPISKLKNILKENYKGNISLEVIAEDTFFVPWKETYETETHRKVEVSFNKEKEIIKEEVKKPSVTVGISSPNKPSQQSNSHSDNILHILKERKIGLKDIQKDIRILTEVVSIYCVHRKLDIKKDIKKIEDISFNVIKKLGFK
jgi:hypothetical protein